MARLEYAEHNGGKQTIHNKIIRDNQRQIIINTVTRPMTTKWEAPNKNTYKINVDAPILDQAIVLGCIIWNQKIVAGAEECASVSNLMELAEATAIHIGFQLAKDAGIRPATIESSAITFYNLIRGTYHYENDLQPVVENIQEHLKRGDVTGFRIPVAKQMAQLMPLSSMPKSTVTLKSGWKKAHLG